MLAGFIIGATVALFAWCLHFILKTRHYPPGPYPLPFIGNLHQVPRKNQWRKIKEWHDKYGPIITVYFGLRPMIFIGSYQCAKDLLFNRGSIHSSRPTYFNDGVGSHLHTVGLQYGPQWRTHRYMLHSFLNPSECRKYASLQDVESRQLLHELLTANDFQDKTHRFAASITFALGYGRRMKRGNESEVVEINTIMREILENVHLSTVAFPILNYIPRFFAYWKQRTDYLSKKQSDFFTHNFQKALDRPNWNWSRHLEGLNNIQSGSKKDLTLTEMAYIIGTSYEAGSDTTAFVLQVFALASVLHPDKVRKAQAELDSVLACRMPALDDIGQLPYTNAFIQETLRWRPVVPGGIQRMAAKNDQYHGYTIPGQTVLVPNHWSLEFDPATFEDPWAFRPERWIEHPDLPSSAFGFGRRICPGQHLARNSLNLVIPRMLWAFDFHTKDASKLDPFNLTQGISSRPENFDIQFRPRSETHRTVIENDWRECDKESWLE